jgi:hypothetical protein
MMTHLYINIVDGQLFKEKTFFTIVIIIIANIIIWKEVKFTSQINELPCYP